MNRPTTMCYAIVFAAFIPAALGQTDNLVVRASVTLSRHSTVAAKESGVIRKIHCREGKLVLRDAPLFQLDDQRQQLLVSAAKLNLQIADMMAADQLAMEAAEAQLESARAEIKAKEVALQIAEAEARSRSAVEIAEAEKSLKQQELDRAQNARDSFKGSISAAQLDRLQTAVRKGTLEIQQAKDNVKLKALRPDAARAELQQLRQQAIRFETLVRQERQTLQVAKATSDVRRNELQIAELNRTRRQGIAPFDGLVVKVEKQVGEWVEEGAPIARIIDLKTLRAEGFVQINQASQSLVGKAAVVKVRSGKKTLRIPATITFVSPEVDPVNQQCNIWAEFDNSKFQINPGLPATIEVSLDSANSRN